ncbi:uncharacterized protein BDV17DRAFT_156476 [Aspergillus undulatus]|uniref:uncharacterized protein n=1 Tax=Aspergillus undulatus TaxID=1810928 RepID=UPI003CCCDF54
MLVNVAWVAALCQRVTSLPHNTTSPTQDFTASYSQWTRAGFCLPVSWVRHPLHQLFNLILVPCFCSSHQQNNHEASRSPEENLPSTPDLQLFKPSFVEPLSKLPSIEWHRQLAILFMEESMIAFGRRLVFSIANSPSVLNC